MIEAELRDRVLAWQALDPDPATRAELERLLRRAEGDDPSAARTAADELRHRFDGRLQFGTAGLRAAMGAGPRRMNRLVVQQTAAGLGRWLREGPTGAGANGGAGAPPSVVIGWDARHRSAEFALDAARVVAAAGIRAMLLPAAEPTPVLAFAVRHLHADAGVMCTASHNPPEDNGLKVYGPDGAQIVAPADREIAAAVDDVARTSRPLPVAPADHPAIVRVDGAVVAAYRAHVAALPALARRPALAGGAGGGRPGSVRLVYTPLHGVGGELAVELLQRAGFTDLHLVAAQWRPDGDFPTTPYPNPEEPPALDLALAEADRVGADLILANDPDADRLGVAVPASSAVEGGGRWRVLSGNEIGALLCDYVLAQGEGPDRLVVSSFVSTRLVPAIARFHGVHHREVLTGFKWIVRPAIAHPEWRFVFGFEEALGYAVDDYVRDKDGLAAAVAVARLVEAAAAVGRTVEDELERLSRRHGHHASRTWSVRLPGYEATDRVREVVRRWRMCPPRRMAGLDVRAVRDLGVGGDLPPTDAVVVDLDGRARVVVRPSGTEPKVKLYVEVVVDVPAGPQGFLHARQRGDAAVEDVRAAVARDLRLVD